jgi:glycosyltransferase involved in cell wall biosynthesis
MKRSDKVVVVTKYFKTYIDNKYRKNHKTVVISNSVNTKSIGFSEEWRNKIRCELNCQESLLVVYSGRIKREWQSFDKNAAIFNKIKKKFSNAKFLVLTRDTDILLSDYNLSKEDTMLISVDNKDIYKYLSAGDVGLLVRDKNIVNEVAFPIKFTEYMACGLPVIVSKGMTGICEIIENRGVIYDNDDSVFEALSGMKKDNIIKFSKEELEISVIAQNYQKLYKEL